MSTWPPIVSSALKLAEQRSEALRAGDEGMSSSTVEPCPVTCRPCAQHRHNVHYAIRHINAWTSFPGDRSIVKPVELPPAVRSDRGSIAVAVAEQLKEMILAGRLEPGDRLPNEADLCEHFGVSRITIREAMQMLRALGLVEPTRGRGTFVREPDAEAVLRDLAYFAFASENSVGDLFEVRFLLETTAARRAARQADTRAKISLSELADHGVALLAQSEEPPLDALATLDAEFHLAISQLSGNLVLEQLTKRLMILLEPVRSRSMVVPGQPAKSWQQHVDIAKAIDEADPEKASDLLRAHLGGVTDALRVT